MGVPGLLSHIGKGERVALAKLAIEHLETKQRPLRVAIDAAIWNFQNQASQGGKNPALRTLFFRLLKLLALPIHPVFVYDGKNKPLTKRGKTVSRYGTCIPNEMSKKLVAMFHFPHHTAPGEAEAECSQLQKNGIVDAVMSQDVDAIMFGSTLTLRDWSKEGTRGNKTPTHVNVLDQRRIKELSGLDPDGMVLVALLSGGDYHEGIPGCGSALACSIAKAGFGTELLKLLRKDDHLGLREWRERLNFELETNESGYFAKRNKLLKIPSDFPDRQILSYYIDPVVTAETDLTKLEAKWVEQWDYDIDVLALRNYTGITFDWLYRSGGKRFVRCFAQPYFQSQLRRAKISDKSFSVDNITEKRQHFIADGMPELRFSAIPAEIVGLDLNSEEENPEYTNLEADDNEDQAEQCEQISSNAEDLVVPSSPSKSKRRPSWDAYAVEKWWVPQTLLRIGLPSIHQDWEDYQRQLLTDPVKFATRKCPKPSKAAKSVDRDTKQASLTTFFGIRKAAAELVPKTDLEENLPCKNVSVPSDATRAETNAPEVRGHSKVHVHHVSVQASPTANRKKSVSKRSAAAETTTKPHERRRPPIESFFGLSGKRDADLSLEMSEKELAALAVSSLLQDPSELAAGTQKLRKTTISRESLPGTWTEARLPEAHIGETSIIDLTAD